MFSLLLLQSPEQAEYPIVNYKYTDLSRLSRDLGVIFTPPLTTLTSSLSYKPVPVLDGSSPSPENLISEAGSPHIL